MIQHYHNQQVHIFHLWQHFLLPLQLQVQLLKDMWPPKEDNILNLQLLHQHQFQLKMVKISFMFFFEFFQLEVFLLALNGSTRISPNESNLWGTLSKDCCLSCLQRAVFFCFMGCSCILKFLLISIFQNSSQLIMIKLCWQIIRKKEHLKQQKLI